MARASEELQQQLRRRERGLATERTRLAETERERRSRRARAATNVASSTSRDNNRTNLPATAHNSIPAEEMEVDLTLEEITLVEGAHDHLLRGERQGQGQDQAGSCDRGQGQGQGQGHKRGQGQGHNHPGRA